MDEIGLGPIGGMLHERGLRRYVAQGLLQPIRQDVVLFGALFRDQNLDGAAKQVSVACDTRAYQLE